MPAAAVPNDLLGFDETSSKPWPLLLSLRWKKVVQIGSSLADYSRQITAEHMWAFVVMLMRCFTPLCSLLC